MARALILTLFLTAAAFAAPPHRVIGNVYYVGEDDLACFLITTPQGNILVNTGYEFSVPVIRNGAKALGIKYEDIKILLVTHAHGDHAAGLAKVRQQTHAKMWAIEQEVPLLESGGKTDFLFGPLNYFAPVKVDHVFKDGDQISLGGTVITAHWTPGHTKGATSYSFDVTEQGRVFHVLIANLPVLNDGVELLHNEKYPNIVQDYLHSFDVLESLPCDIFLASHTGQYQLTRKYQYGQPYNPLTYYDPDGYRNSVARLKASFLEALQDEKDEEQMYHDHLNFKDITEPPGPDQPVPQQP